MNGMWEIIMCLFLIIQELVTAALEGMCIIVTFDACTKHIQVRRKPSIFLLFLLCHLTNFLSLVRGCIIFYQPIEDMLDDTLDNWYALLRDLISLLVIYRLALMVERAKCYSSFPCIFLIVTMITHCIIFIVLLALNWNGKIFGDYRSLYFLAMQTLVLVAFLMVYIKYVSTFKHILPYQLKFALLLILILHSTRVISNYVIVIWNVIAKQPRLNDTVFFLFLNLIFLAVTLYFLKVITQGVGKSENYSYRRTMNSESLLNIKPTQQSSEQ